MIRDLNSVAAGSIGTFFACGHEAAATIVFGLLCVANMVAALFSALTETPR